MSARSLAQDGSFSEAFQPSRSIVQGIRSGTRFGRCMVYHILSQITTAHVGMSMRIWVDDLSQRVLGSRRVVRVRLLRVLKDTCSKLQEIGLKAAPKSVLMCSRPADGKYVSKQLQRFGITVSNVLQAPYLGVDLGCGRAARKTRQKRVVKGKSMTSHIRRFAHASKNYLVTGRLARAGEQAACQFLRPPNFRSFWSVSATVSPSSWGCPRFES